VTNTAYQWRSELAKLPAHGVTWSWSDVVGKSEEKCEHSPAYKMLRADYIIKLDGGVYMTSEDLEEYLAEHGIELDSLACNVEPH
jgi:hypothetical protein